MMQNGATVVARGALTADTPTNATILHVETTFGLFFATGFTRTRSKKKGNARLRSEGWLQIGFPRRG